MLVLVIARAPSTQGLRFVTGALAAFASTMVWLACAARPPAPRSPMVADADAALLQGCYDCLIEARRLYRSAATGASAAALMPRMFETDLLIALREKELGLPASGALADAH